MGAVLFEVQLRDLAMGSRRVMVDISESAEDLANSSASNFAPHVFLEGESVSLVPDEESAIHHDALDAMQELEEFVNGISADVVSTFLQTVH